MKQAWMVRAGESVDIDKFAELLVDYYETFDIEGKALIPLVRIYWPADN